MNLRELSSWKNALAYRQKVAGLMALGVIVGLAGLFAYLLRMHTCIIGDNPAACVNCHIMTPYYATWSHSPHGRDVTCNDCHVSHQNLFMKYYFKGKDGMKHVYYFVTNGEAQTIKAEDASVRATMDNCIRYHTQLNQELVKTRRIDYMMTKRGEGLAHWECYEDVPHEGMNSLSGTPHAETQVPLPESPVPLWLQGLLDREK